MEQAGGKMIINTNPPDFSEVPQPNDKCACGHVANNHHGIAWLCWTPHCDCPGFLKAMRFPTETELSGAD